MKREDILALTKPRKEKEPKKKRQRKPNKALEKMKADMSEQVKEKYTQHPQDIDRELTFGERKAIEQAKETKQILKTARNINVQGEDVGVFKTDCATVYQATNSFRNREHIRPFSHDLDGNAAQARISRSDATKDFGLQNKNGLAGYCDNGRGTDYDGTCTDCGDCDDPKVA